MAMKNMFALTAMASAAALLSACGGGGGGGGGTPPSFVSCVGDVCTLSGNVNEDYRLDTDKTWQIDGVVTVGAGNVEITSDAQAAAIKAAGVTLTIPAGTDIKAFDDAVLLITRGSKLEANGTANAPITFSSLDANFDGEGEWGGVVIQGFAPQYGSGNTGVCHGANTYCNIAGEGGDFVGNFGGDDEADDSGTIRYVRIAEGGLIAGPNSEINGLTLMGVGHGTAVEYVQVHSNLDDGVEWFGGTVNVKHLVLTNNDDDDLDYDEGYMGNIQFAIIKKNQVKTVPTGSNDPRGIEANSSDTDFVPQTNATIANVTLLGGPVNNGADNGLQPGMRLRGAVTTSIYNTAVKNFNTGCIRIDDANTDGIAGADEFSDILLKNVLADCANGLYTGSRVADDETNATATTLTFDAAFAITEGTATVAAAAIPAVNNGSGFEFDQTTYVGAVAPGTSAANAWWANWTLPNTVAP